MTGVLFAIRNPPQSIGFYYIFLSAILATQLCASSKLISALVGRNIRPKTRKKEFFFARRFKVWFLFLLGGRSSLWIGCVKKVQSTAKKKPVFVMMVHTNRRAWPAAGRHVLPPWEKMNCPLDCVDCVSREKKRISPIIWMSLSANILFFSLVGL